MKILEKIWILLSLLGCLFFGSAFLLSFLNPMAIEKLAEGVIKAKIESKVRDQIDTLEALLQQKAGQLYARQEQAIAQLKRDLQTGLADRIEADIKPFQNPDCPCRNVAQTITARLQMNLANLNFQQTQLTQQIQYHYRNTAQQLLTEFRLFTGLNAGVFLMMALTVMLRPQTRKWLLPVGITLLLATLLTALAYLFWQNWLLTLLFGSYVGWGYAINLLLVFLLLSDLLLNEARVTSNILSMLSIADDISC